MTNWSRSFAQLIEAKMRRFGLFSYSVILRLENNPNAVIAMQRFSIVETTAWKNFCDWRLPESRLLGVVLVLEKKRKNVHLTASTVFESEQENGEGWVSQPPKGMVSTKFAFLFHSSWTQPPTLTLF